MVVGIDIGSEIHCARAFDWRNYEYSKKPFVFTNDEEGFEAFRGWINAMKEQHGKTNVIPGMEPTGHYWFNLGRFLQDNNMRPVHVNPHHVKKSKEMDDNNPSKNDRKDPKVIAALVNEGRFSYPYMPSGVYAEIRSLYNLHMQAQSELTRIKNRMAKWFSVYFPNYKEVYRSPGAVSGLMILKQASLPKDIVELGAEGVNTIWRDAKLRGAGMKRAKTLVAAAEHSVGSREAAEAARIEIRLLLSDYERYAEREKVLMQKLEEKLMEVPYIGNLLKIRGIGMKTVAGFIAEVGDIRRFDNPKQLQKLAGYAIVASESGKHKGESRISYRGRKRLRYVLYEAALSAVCYNPDFKAIHQYYTTRKRNPLKKMQSHISRVKYLGYGFYRYKGECRLKVHQKSLVKMKNSLRVLTNRSKAISNEDRPLMLSRFIKGWVNYFKLADMKGMLRQVDEWLRRRIRAIYWKQWKKVKTRYRMIKQYNLPEWKVHELANCRKGIWRAAVMLNSVLTNKEIARQGYITMSSYYEQVCEN